jgi:autotransporter-associated beta strand protein
MMPCVASAANSDWTTTGANGNWADAANWSAGVPGAVSASVFDNLDTATFNAAISAARTVTVDTNRNIFGITFSNTSNNNAYTLSGGSLNITNGGLITSSGTGGAKTDIISTNMVLRGDNGSATISNTSPTANRILSITGGVTGASTAGNTTTLTLGGTNTSANVVSGVIGNGGAGGTLALVKDGTGTWIISGTNTYTGTTTINAGRLVLGAGSTTGSLGTGSVTNNGTLVFNRNNTYTAANNISGSGGLEVNTGTVLTLTGTNSYSGGTVVNAGMVTFQGANSLPSNGTITLNSSGSLAVNNPASQNTLSAWLGSGRIATGSTGAVAIGTGDAATNIDFAAAGYANLSLGAATAVTYTGTLTPLASGYRLGGGAGTLTVPGNLNAPTSLTVIGGAFGTVSLTGASTYTGVTNVVNGGVLVISNANALGDPTGAVSVNAGSLRLSGGITTPSTKNLTIQTIASGDTATSQGNGLVNVSGANTWAGNITGNGDGTNNFRITNLGTAGPANLLTVAGNITRSGTFNTITGSGATGLVVSGSGDINVTGAISGAIGFITTNTATVRLQGNNTFSGGVRFQGSTILEVSSLNSTDGTGAISASSSLGAPANATAATIFFAQNNTSANNGTIRYVGTGETTNRILSINGNSGSITLDQSGTGTLNYSAAPSVGAGGAKTVNLTGSTAGVGELSGVLGNGATAGSTIAVTKTGTGTWVLSAANTYTGATTVSAGTLLVTGSLSTTATTVAGELGGTGSIAGNVTVQSGGRLTGGAGAPSGALSLGGNLTLATGSVVELALGPGGSHSTIARTGAGTFSFASGQSFEFDDLGAAPGVYDNIITGLASDPGVSSFTIANSGWAGTFTFDGANVDLTLTAIPEPASVGLLAVSGIGLLMRRRRARVV